MKLPNFRDHSALNELRRKMRAELVAYDPEESGPRRITRKDLERLKTTGVVVNPDEIETLANGIFTYQGVPVLLYIYSPTQWTEQQVRLPRYHVCNCRTWFDMKAKGRQDRYVASTRLDGYFELEVYIASLRSSRKTLEKLRVCQNCLDYLSWKGFRIDGMTSSKRMRFVDTFALDEFFEHFGRSQVREKPRWTPNTIPFTSYTDDFDEISSRARAAARWRCQEPGCERLLVASWQRRYLHLHHRNGVKGDNSHENLTVLCIEHHAKQPNHAHLKNGRDYSEFMELFHGAGALQRERALSALVHGGRTTSTTGQPKYTSARTNGTNAAPGAIRRRLVDRLKAANLTFKDHRPKGCLWVIGDASLKPFFDELRNDGMPFRFAPQGGSTTGHRPGWFTTSTR